MKFFREPLVQFMFIGTAIYMAFWLFAEPAPEETQNTITVTAGELKWMETAWQKRYK